MGKRFESGASKRKRQRLENAMAMKLRPGTAVVHQPLTEATRASSEATQPEPTASRQPDENLPEKEAAKQDVEEQADYEEAAMSLARTENIELIQESLTGQGEAKEPQGNDVNTQSLQFTPGKTGQVQDVPDADKENAKHTSTVTDVGLWSELSHEEISYWVERGPSQVLHHCGPFSNSKRVYKKQSRFCRKALFYSTKANGETYRREWLVYSPSKGRIYCFVCKLFPNLASSSTALATEGFDDWENPHLIQTHENSEKHRNAMLAYLTRNRGQMLTSKLEEQIKIEQQYWRHVTERIVAVIRSLVERGLPFRGDNEHFGSPNNGNYLGVLELVAKFDPFLLAHINQYGHSGSGNSSSLSTLCEEVIQLMAKEVKDVILADVKRAGYFSFSVDSTLDISHTDQLALMIRYVSPEDGLPTERFLSFLELKDYSGESLSDLVFNYFTAELEVDFRKCRGQSYDNAANMAGKYNRMQQRIIEKNQFARFIPCAGHSLNLVGQSAVDCCLDAVNCFDIINKIYTFFSSSVKRWAVLKSFLPPQSKVPKYLSDTRWEAHAKATEAVLESYSAITAALSHLYSDVNGEGETRIQADNLLKKMEELEFVFMLHFWTRVLGHFHKVSKALQKSDLLLSSCASLYGSVLDFLSKIREDFDELEEQAKVTLPNGNYETRRQRLRERQRNDRSAPDTLDTLSSRDKFRITTFIPILDALEANFKRRSTVYSDVAQLFSILTNLTASKQEIQQGVELLMEAYPEDIDLKLINELLQFHLYVRQNHRLTEEHTLSHRDLYQIIFKEKIQMAFPNVEAILRLFLSFMVPSCLGERSFSRLEKIKNGLRATMSQERLSALSILYIESDKLQKTSFDEVLDDFAMKKAQNYFV